MWGLDRNEATDPGWDCRMCGRDHPAQRLWDVTATVERSLPCGRVGVGILRRRGGNSAGVNSPEAHKWSLAARPVHNGVRGFGPNIVRIQAFSRIGISVGFGAKR